MKRADAEPPKTLRAPVWSAARVTRRVVLVGCAAATLLSLLLVARPAGATQPYGACTETTTAISAAAGSASVSLTVPAGHYYNVQAMRWVYTPDANVGNRTLAMRYADGGGNFFFIEGVTVATASTLVVVDMSDTQVVFPSISEVQVNAPNITLQPTWVFRLQVSGQKAGDTWGGIIEYCDGTSASYTQPVSGTVTANEGASPWTVHVDNNPTSITVSNPQTAVTVSNTVAISGSITATGVAPCQAAVTTTTDPTGNADARLSPCVQPVSLDESSNIALFTALGLALLAGGLVFGVKLVRGAA